MNGTFLAAGGDSEGREKLRSLQNEENSEDDGEEEEESNNFFMEHLGFTLSRDLRAITLENGGAEIMVTFKFIYNVQVPPHYAKYGGFLTER